MSLRDIEALANAKLREHNLYQIGWRFKWDRAQRRVGQCRFGAQEIGLSKPIYSITANEPDAINTILHEIAHALAGPHAGHGPEWKRVAHSIGCSAQRCAPVHMVRPETKFTGTCGCSDYKHRMTRLSRAYDGSIVAYKCRMCRTTIHWVENW